jgi:hypothetical protein
VFHVTVVGVGLCSPSLSSEPVFRVDTLECWQVRWRKRSN